MLYVTEEHVTSGSVVSLFALLVFLDHDQPVLNSANFELKQVDNL